MKPVQMVSLELDDEEKMDMAYPTMVDKPDYPYGTKICLTHKELDKMGFSHEDMIVGGVVHIHSLGRITSVSASDDASGTQSRIEIQLEDMAIESEDEENSEY